MFQLFSRSAAQGLSAKDAVEAARAGDVIVIDIRELTEVRSSGIAKGALHIPLMMLQFRADPRHPDYDKRLRQDARIAVYCASGARSSSAKQFLEQLGYSDVHNIGGLTHWARAGGEVVPA